MLKVTKLLLAAAAALGMSSALAGYAYPAPPAGYSRVGDAWTYRAANASEWLGSTVRTNATLNVGGRAVTIPAALRMAANAPRFAAATLFSPAGMAAAAGAAILAPLIADLWANHQMRWNPDSQRWEKESSGLQWKSSSTGDMRFSSLAQGCAYVYSSGWAHSSNPLSWTLSNVTATTGQCVIVDKDGMGVAGYNFDTIAGPPQVVPVSQPEFEGAAYPYIDPEDVPELVPGKAIPVEYPDINPSDDPVPQPRPMRIPLGDPVRKPNPAYDPVTNPTAPPYIWERPYVVINPSPRPDTPWRVDTQPETIFAPDPSKLPDNPADPLTDGDPSTNPSPNPSPLPDLSTPTTPSTPTPTEIITCGLPSTPPCKIDEQGTPEPDPQKTQAEADNIFSEIKNCVLNPSQCLPALPSLNWGFSLPSGCAAIPFDTLVGKVIQIDMCEYQPMIHELMSMVWAAAGLFFATGMVFRSAVGN